MQRSRTRHNRRTWPLVAVLSLAVGLGTSVAVSAEKAKANKDKKDEGKEKQSTEEVLVITNDDQISSLHQSSDSIVGHIESGGHPEAANIARGGDPQRLVGDQCQLDADPLRRPE